MKKTINITQRDIDKGERRNCEGCPVYLALRRTTNVRYVGVRDIGFIRGDGPDRFVLVKTPSRIRDFMVQFDDGHAVKPTRFTIEVPDDL